VAPGAWRRAHGNKDGFIFFISFYEGLDPQGCLVGFRI
jgi:hypothetical protein